VRAGARHTEQLGQLVFHPRRDGVLEAVSLFVRVGPVETEGVGEPTLEQPVTPRHHLGNVSSLRGQRQLLAPSDLDVAAAREPLDGLGHGGRGDRHVLGQACADHRLAAAGQIVDGGEIVLDGGGGADRTARF
jgi:hypothetical protein